MSKRVELPLIEPLYSTYHGQGPCTSIIMNNESIRNWYLNEKMNLTCTSKFLNGFTTPEITIVGTSWWDCPYLERINISSRFTQGYINPIIRNLLNEGYYVAFKNVDDYYVEGKSWYNERHFNHDGLICGYDQKDKTYCVYAYDSNWIYRKFWTSQASFNKARLAMRKQGEYCEICALKVKNDVVEFSSKVVYDKLKEYLDSDIEKYPFNSVGRVFGNVVHDYIAEYIKRLYRGEIPYERMDRRVFRLIWEHKKAMLERIKLVENQLGLDGTTGHKYAQVVKEADTIRMLYASHHMKRRDSVLPVIRKKLMNIKNKETDILKRFIERVEGVTK